MSDDFRGAGGQFKDNDQSDGMMPHPDSNIHIIYLLSYLLTY